MTTIILRDASRWQSISPVKENVLLRLYSDKAIAGYVLPGVPELRPGDPFAVGESGSILDESVIH